MDSDTRNEQSPEGVGEPQPSGQPSQARELVHSASINSIGNVASRLLGLVREAVVSGIFGVSGATSAFDAVSGVPKMVYELLVGGMLSAALVPVLSEYAADDRQAELDHILSTLLTMALVVLGGVVILLELTAPYITPVLVGGFDDSLLATATRLTRLIVPSILIYGISGIIQAYHYARKKFVYPSMGAPAHNLGMIVAVLLFASQFGIESLSISMLAASGTQLLMQLPGLKGTKLRLVFDWRNPAVSRILKLYAPVVLSVVISNAGIIIDRNLASRTAVEAITWMNKATFLIQLPLGLVSMAIALAVLPSLSRLDARTELDKFKHVFGLGVRMTMVLIIPAAVGLLVLGRPLIQAIFEHGAFNPADTQASLNALYLYLIGMPFSAIDLLLVYAFYAQKDTKTPVVVGVLGVLIYLAVGPLLAFVFHWGYLGLVAANAAQLTGHALIMLAAFARRFSGLRDLRLLDAGWRSLLASLAVAVLGWGSYQLLQRLPVGGGYLVRLAMLGVALAAAGAGYLAAANWLKIGEIASLVRVVRQRLRRAA
ncbi:MAG: murein biosynthesis integral membrane protein MurJ [Chloroflexi bacterium]|nr:murein biosynthesis integral membrane protein MurJ [Chloroflexota bacterium]